MIIDQYAHIHSPLHTWDTRLKILFLVLFTFISTSVYRPWSLTFILLFSIFLILLARLPLSSVLRALKAPFFFLAIMMLILMLTAGGRIIFQYGIIKIYKMGLISGSTIIVKALCIIITLFCIFNTAPLRQNMKALECLKVPRLLIVILLFTYRYIFLYLADLKNLVIAAKLRGYKAHRMVKNIKTVPKIIATLLVRSAEQSERVYAAMCLRGFSGSIKILKQFKATVSDVLKSAFVVIVCIFIIIVEIL